MGTAPEEIDVGAFGLVLRRWRTTDAASLLAAIERSQAELRRFMPWAQEPPTPAAVAAFLETASVDGSAPASAGYGLFDAAGELVGAAGLHDRRGPGVVEIGYWVRSDRAGRGYATAAARALTRAVFASGPGTDRIEIRCDPANRASGAIPPKLGYRLDRTDVVEVEAADQTGEQQVWVMTRAGYLATERW